MKPFKWNGREVNIQTR